ncbi:MAG: choice-of-anchor B family protein [Woeseia sp.]
MNFSRAIPLLSLFACLSPGPSEAHGDASIPLYVAADGQDIGRCSDTNEPCQSIGYALRQAGKGSQIRVAEGSYAIDTAEDLFLLISGMVNVSGGYERANGFRVAGSGETVLTGVPAEYRQLLLARGLQIVVDRKGLDGPRSADASRFMAVHQKLQKGAVSGPCIGGMTDSLACSNVDLLAHIPLDEVSRRPSRGNDVWGFTDLNSGREYVVAGYNIGTGVFDITDPTAPVEVGFVDGQNASWRDLKVYQHFDTAAGRWRAYAYVTTDGSSDGLFVIDMSDLPHSVRRVAYNSQFSRAHNVYGSSADFSTGIPLTENPRLIIAGSNIGSGQFRAYSLDDPTAPAFVSGSSVPNTLPNTNDPSYMHDAASLLITDQRKDTQCVNASTYCELLLDFNEQNIEIWDITDSSDPRWLNPGMPQYANRGYVHSGWWSEDRQFMFVHDELDEQQSGLNTTLRVFSIADLTAPTLVGQWTGPTAAIDHNGFVRGNRYYMSNYSRGLTILDISNPAAPVTTGRLDTYPFSDQQGFVGAWGVYPFFLSGTVAISDINSGVYLAADRSRDNSAGGLLSFSVASFSATEGLSTTLQVDRNGSGTGAVSVGVEVVHATAGTDDYTLSNALLNWANGDNAPKTISLAATADGIDEDNELLLVRLVRPDGGAALGNQHTAYVHLSDPAAPASVRLFANEVNVGERGFGKAVIVVQRLGDTTSATSVDFAPGAATATPGVDYTGSTSGTLSWAAGDGNPQWLEFDISDDGTVEGDEYFDLEFGNVSGGSMAGSAVVRIGISDGTGVNNAPAAIVASSITVAENSSVTLDGSQSSDADGDTLTYAWQQTSGPAVTLTSTTTASTQFTAPTVASDALLQFRLTVSDPGGLSASATVSVTVTNNSSGGSGGAGGGAAGGLLLLAASALARRRRITQTDGA